jgi:hypothetical protein
MVIPALFRKRNYCLPNMIKAAEQAKLQALRNEILETRGVQQKKEDEIRILKEHMAKMEESQLKITELL